MLRMYDIIMHKRDGAALSKEEIQFVVEGYTKGEIPDYQVSALLMAIYFKGMNEEETVCLTQCMANSGDKVDLSAIEGIKVDKHSTGGVGDKTTLIVAPIVASLGVPVAKMSGRGLGHTGGTVDKLESIPGFQTTLTSERFFEIVNTIGISVIGQTGNIAPGDKKLYALRDVTATVDQISLIAASIMSKKIAAGADAILLDVKTGSGAFMKTLEDSILLGKEMVSIGEGALRKTVALITDMDRPLGFAIGNTLEVAEAVETLRGHGPEDLTAVCISLAANMLYLAQQGEIDHCTALAKDAIASGRGLLKLREMVIAQGGDVSVIDDPSRFPQAKIIHPVVSAQTGFISAMNTEQCGIASVVLGAGRVSKEDSIDFTAGIVLHKKVGDYVTQGEAVATLYTSGMEKAMQGEKILLDALTFSQQQPPPSPFIYARITKEGVTLT